MPQFRIIPTNEWGAAPPKQAITPAGTPHEIVFHHTAGHHQELDHKPTESLAEAKGYARSIQQSHFSRGFIDTGQNFLVTRSGHILEGRHGSLAAINSGHMVVSAHCVGHNKSPGIEHEHIGSEKMTKRQRQASVWLHAHICRKTGINPSEIHGHREFNPTECPSNVFFRGLAGFKNDVRQRLAQPD
jgi:N-acetylmuramoyl-L-alanine amidase